MQALAGIETILIDQTQEAADKGKGYSEKLLAKRVSRGRMDQAESQAVLDRITATTDFAALQARLDELRALLAERIAGLKPRDGNDFGTTEAWRHYNALYFPYVVGVRAYAQNATAASRQFGSWNATTSPGPTPRACSPAARRRASRSTSPNVPE